jgi:hypothetical protein
VCIIEKEFKNSKCIFDEEGVFRGATLTGVPMTRVFTLKDSHHMRHKGMPKKASHFFGNTAPAWSLECGLSVLTADRTLEYIF